MPAPNAAWPATHPPLLNRAPPSPGPGYPPLQGSWGTPSARSEFAAYPVKARPPFFFFFLFWRQPPFRQDEYFSVLYFVFSPFFLNYFFSFFPFVFSSRMVVLVAAAPSVPSENRGSPRDSAPGLLEVWGWGGLGFGLGLSVLGEDALGLGVCECIIGDLGYFRGFIRP